jgi:hypothetical protein
LQLPRLPSKISIARRLIDGVVKQILEPAGDTNDV